MIDEQSARRAEFEAGVPVHLADGQTWWLPASGPEPGGPHDQALLAAFTEAEGRADHLRAVLALSVHLVTRNYDLSPDDLGALLSFTPDDPAGPKMRAVVEGLAAQALVRGHADAQSAAGAAGQAVALARYRARPRSGWLRRLWPLWTS